MPTSSATFSVLSAWSCRWLSMIALARKTNAVRTELAPWPISERRSPSAAVTSDKHVSDSRLAVAGAISETIEAVRCTNGSTREPTELAPSIRRAVQSSVRPIRRIIAAHLQADQHHLFARAADPGARALDDLAVGTDGREMQAFAVGGGDFAEKRV